jgi:50S ribosomal subunit-associated GTPase HflX
MVFNKIDKLIDNDEFTLIQEEFPNSIFISAYNEKSISELLMLLQNKYNTLSQDIEIFLPYSESNLISKVYQFSEVLMQSNNDEGYVIKLRVQNNSVGSFQNVFSSFIKS